MPTPKLRAIGWNPFFDAQLTPTDLHSTVIARVSAHHGSQVEVYAEDGEFRVPIQSAEARAFNSRDMDENVAATALRSDEAITLGSVEPLHSTSRHCRPYQS